MTLDTLSPETRTLTFPESLRVMIEKRFAGKYELEECTWLPKGLVMAKDAKGRVIEVFEVKETK